MTANDSSALSAISPSLGLEPVMRPALARLRPSMSHPYNHNPQYTKMRSESQYDNLTEALWWFRIIGHFKQEVV